TSKRRESRGESNTRCNASVSSTTPRFGPRCPPAAETLSMRNSRISADSSASSSCAIALRSSGPRRDSSSATLHLTCPCVLRPSSVRRTTRSVPGGETTSRLPGSRRSACRQQRNTLQVLGHRKRVERSQPRQPIPSCLERSDIAGQCRGVAGDVHHSAGARRSDHSHHLSTGTLPWWVEDNDIDRLRAPVAAPGSPQRGAHLTTLPTHLG